jgi:hypothetical protein
MQHSLLLALRAFKVHLRLPFRSADIADHPLPSALAGVQGLRCWVPLASSNSSGGGTNVGAVQIAVQLTELAGLSASSSNSSSSGGQREALLLRSAEAAALLPAALRAPLLLPAGAGFRGQAAVAAVHLDVLLPPSSGCGSRPKADRYYCRYSLPNSGSSGSGGCTATAARVLTAVGAPGVPSNRRGSGAGQSQQPPLQQQQWVAKMDHAGFFEVGYLKALQLLLVELSSHLCHCCVGCPVALADPCPSCPFSPAGVGRASAGGCAAAGAAHGQCLQAASRSSCCQWSPQRRQRRRLHGNHRQDGAAGGHS